MSNLVEVQSSPQSNSSPNPKVSDPIESKSPVAAALPSSSSSNDSIMSAPAPQSVDGSPSTGEILPTFRPGHNVELMSGHFSMQGVRNEMEDKVVLLQQPEFNKSANLRDSLHRSFFAVFDGHGGDVSAEYCRQHVHVNFLAEKSFLTNPSLALRSALLRTDAEFCGACRRINLLTSSGTTALAVYIQGSQLICANIGDSRGVLCRSGRAIPVSHDHKPGRKEERERIESLGGRVGITEDEAFNTKPKSCVCLKEYFAPKRPLRVFPGGLSVSRTIGDISMKSTALIIADPEMFTIMLTPLDSFLVLACDGVWDVMNNQQVVDCVRKFLHLNDAEEAARQLAKEAYRRGSTDNISTIVVIFKHDKKSTAAANLSSNSS